MNTSILMIMEIKNNNWCYNKHQHDQTINIYNYDEDDFNDNIQNVLLQSIDINNENSNDNNIKFSVVNNHFNSCMGVEENKKKML